MATAAMAAGVVLMALGPFDLATVVRWASFTLGLVLFASGLAIAGASLVRWIRLSGASDHGRRG